MYLCHENPPNNDYLHLTLCVRVISLITGNFIVVTAITQPVHMNGCYRDSCGIANTHCSDSDAQLNIHLLLPVRRLLTSIIHVIALNGLCVQRL